ncbi:hypothetical protein BGZ95_005243 [Linnemannia exigua]|uniref:Uncharacterized protein n=1 Tax=Linnemannia exigua TaxID=604196 RepID=A0AAD4D2H2_9FUNG|nr:hypothetical protein BGZ95_005243 [Linnemannia exigua]
MILTPAASTFTLLAALALASTAYADVLSSNPIEGTHWKIGSSAQIRWRLNKPTSKDDYATIYLVGGDPAAYKRLKTLGTKVRLGDHTLDIPEVEDWDCLGTCAIEWVVLGEDDKANKGDFYSHVFSITATGEAPPTASTEAVADNSAPVVAGSIQSASTPKGAPLHADNDSSSTSGAIVTRMGVQGMAAMAVAAAVSAIGMAIL